MDNALVAYLDSGVSVNISLVERERYLRIFLCIFVGQLRVDDCADVDILDELDKALYGDESQLRVEHLLVSCARVGAQSEA